MLHTLLGETNFAERDAALLLNADGSAATCDDFVRRWKTHRKEHQSAVSTAGIRAIYPIVSVSDDYNPETEQYTLTIRQRTPATAERKEKLPLRVRSISSSTIVEGEVIPLQKDGHPVQPASECDSGRADFCV